MGAYQFKDHFSSDAQGYSRYRPGYPAVLFDRLAALTPERNLAWDCATGNGQAAQHLARLYNQVIATDASPEQLAIAPDLAKVSYQAAPAERSPLASGSADLITVAQALHWFDLPAFTREADRVLKPAGVLAVWTYTLLSIAPELDAVMQDLHDRKLGACWPEERQVVEQGYQSISMPFAEEHIAPCTMEAHWDLDQLLGYISTWSAVKAFRRRKGSDPVAAVRPALAAAWGDPRQPRRVEWPLKVRVWRR